MGLITRVGTRMGANNHFEDFPSGGVNNWGSEARGGDPHVHTPSIKIDTRVTQSLIKRLSLWTAVYTAIGTSEAPTYYPQGARSS